MRETRWKGGACCDGARERGVVEFEEIGFGRGPGRGGVKEGWLERDTGRHRGGILSRAMQGVVRDGCPR